MKIQFDPNQPFQLDAVNAVADLFDGQAQGAPEYAVINTGSFGALFAGQDQTELGVGNRLLLDEDWLLKNARAIQSQNDIEVADEGAPLEAWELFDAPANGTRACPHFSVEMETGTGKTYVYLRTIFELSQRYGFQKFIIVVPNVAIREGVLKSIEIMAEHFRALYNNLPFEHFVYDARRVNRLRQFATSTTLQVMVINIQAFRTNANVIYNESDKLSGRQPIEFVQAARPIVIIDEPQSVDGTPGAQDSIKALNPLCTLRYSATHKNPYNLMYRLDPIRAFELKLVKQIVVASTHAEGGSNDAFVRLESADYKTGIKAKLRIHAQTAQGPKERAVTVKRGDDLYVRSNERAVYQDGFAVAEINADPDDTYVKFTNGRTLRLHEEIGGMREDIWRVQIEKTVEEHLKREKATRARGVKVLTLFFIDKVANYRTYDAAGHPAKGKFAAFFEETLAKLSKKSEHADLEWLQVPVERLHDGYFAQDRRGTIKDTRGNTQDDDAAYNLIMKDKERLLSMDEPLRFIFSHSALREGWDNPNVFQICTLNESQSAVKKRQEIGRGLRLPVDQEGARVFDESINRLYVMANESYEAFARSLQTEYEEECGVTFGRVPLTALARLTRVVGEEEQPVGREAAQAIHAALVEQQMLDAGGRIQPAFDPRRAGFAIALPEDLHELTPAVVDLLASYQIERLIRRERDEGRNRLRKEVQLSPEFAELWDRIKPRTTYRVQLDSAALVQRTVAELKRRPRIEAPRIVTTTGLVAPDNAGVRGRGLSVSETRVSYGSQIPDILAYLQNETELTRSTLVQILKESGRLGELFNDPQRFLDEVATVIKHELHRVLVDGIKYERIERTGPDAEWEMRRFEDHDGDLINYLTALQVQHSVYEYVVYESEVEREFAKRLDEREDIKLFVKLPDWFFVDTPVGTYTPDWAILKHGEETLYLVRETKSTKDFSKLRNSEADKVRCGERHFEALGVPFAVAVTADEV